MVWYIVGDWTAGHRDVGDGAFEYCSGMRSSHTEADGTDTSTRFVSGTPVMLHRKANAK